MSSTPMQEPSTSSSTNRKAKAKRRRRIGCEFLTDSRRGVLIEYDPASYIVTATGNKIEKSGDLRGLERIMVAGKVRQTFINVSGVLFVLSFLGCELLADSWRDACVFLTDSRR